MSKFSVVIPSWNNLEYLRLCVESLKKNSTFKNQIIVYVNEGVDGTLEWIKSQEGVDFIHAEKNEGICVAVNSCRSLVRAPYIVYMNDDMYVCPGWDGELFKAIEAIGHDKFMLSATLIEPSPVNNASYVSIVENYGDSAKSFNEKKLLDEYKNLKKENWSGSSWPPSVVSTRLWDIVGGYSIEFSPGMYSDPDFSMKLWKYGVRVFMGVGTSKVYHFQSKSTGKIKKNKGEDTFLQKWGMSARVFYFYYLKMGHNFLGASQEIKIPLMERWRNKLKKVYKTF